MADKNDHKDRRTKKKGLISTVLSSPLSLFFMLIVSAFVSSIFEIVGMATEFWDEPGIAHSDSMLRQEIIYAELNLSNNKLSGPIPYTLGSMDNLELIDLSGNFFNQVPNSIINQLIARRLLY